MQTTDQKIWIDVLEGDDASWRALVDRYQRLVFAVTRRTGLSQDEARDCFQQTWTLLYENRRKIATPERISSWLSTTARREALRIISARGGADRGTNQVETSDPSPLADEQLEKLERQALLELAIEELEPSCRKLIKALFFSPESCTYQVIAQQLGISSNSMGSSRQRCLSKLEVILRGHKYLSISDDADTIRGVLRGV